MLSDKGPEAKSELSPSAERSPSLRIIEISSDSENDVFYPPSSSKCASTLQKESERHKAGSTWENDVIELTESESNDSSDFPDLLSPLVKGPLKKLHGNSGRRRPTSEKLTPSYVTTSDDEVSDKDCILVLNDPPGARKPIPRIPHTEGQDIARIRNNTVTSLDSPRKITVPGLWQAAQKSPNNKSRNSVHGAKEQTRRQKYAAELFSELNRDVFGDRLPKNTTLEWSKRLLTTAGRAHWHRSREGVHTTKIELASKILDCDERIRNTLSHEMCHLASWVIDNRPRESHGQFFKSWANKVMHKRPDIHISTRHDYEISYPYEWECEKCSKIYGRYSKSIQPDNCVCGACKAGKLIPLFVKRKNATFKTSRMAMATPRDSPYTSMVRSPGPTQNCPAMHENPTHSGSLDQDVPALLNTLESLSINGVTDQ